MTGDPPLTYPAGDVPPWGVGHVAFGSAGLPPYNPERHFDGIPLGGEGAMWMTGDPAREIASLKEEITRLQKELCRQKALLERYDPIRELTKEYINTINMLKEEGFEP